MAKLTARKNTILASFDTGHGHRYSLRSDGKVLRQLRIFGKLETATIASTLTGDYLNKFHQFKDRYLAREELES